MADSYATVLWADVTGRVRMTQLKTTAGAAALLAAMQAASNAQVLAWWESPVNAGIGAASAAKYQGADQWAQLVFATGAIPQLRLTLPAPQVGCFKADMETIDPANALVAAIVAAAAGSLSDGAGTTATALMSGLLMPTRGTDLTPIG